MECILRIERLEQNGYVRDANGIRGFAEEAVDLYTHFAVSEFFHPFVEIAVQFALYVRMGPGHPRIAYNQHAPHQFIGATVLPVGECNVFLRRHDLRGVAADSRAGGRLIGVGCGHGKPPATSGKGIKVHKPLLSLCSCRPPAIGMDSAPYRCIFGETIS